MFLLLLSFVLVYWCDDAKTVNAQWWNEENWMREIERGLVYLFFLPPLPDFEEVPAVEAVAWGSCFFTLSGCLGTNSAIFCISCFPAKHIYQHNEYTWELLAQVKQKHIRRQMDITHSLFHGHDTQMQQYQWNRNISEVLQNCQKNYLT